MPDLPPYRRVFWLTSITGAAVVAAYLMVVSPEAVMPFLKGVALGGLHWWWVDKRTAWLGGQSSGLPGHWQKVYVGLGVLVYIGLAYMLATVGLKHWIVFAGLFIYKLGIVACGVRLFFMKRKRVSV